MGYMENEFFIEATIVFKETENNENL